MHIPTKDSAHANRAAGVFLQAGGACAAHQSQSHVGVQQQRHAESCVTKVQDESKKLLANINRHLHGYKFLTKDILRA